MEWIRQAAGEQLLTCVRDVVCQLSLQRQMQNVGLVLMGIRITAGIWREARRVKETRVRKTGAAYL